MASVSGRTRSGRECWNLWPVVRTVHTHTRGFFLLLLLSHIDSDLFFLVFLAVVVVVVNRLLSIDLAFSLSMCHNYNRSSSSSQSQSTLARKIKEVATDWRHRSKSLFYPPTKKKFPMTKSLKKENLKWLWKKWGFLFTNFNFWGLWKFSVRNRKQREGVLWRKISILLRNELRERERGPRRRITEKKETRQKERSVY
jgi:hypothetical protein